MFDNHRMLHARTAFVGDRHLQGTYLSRDAFRTALFDNDVQAFTFSKNSAKKS